MEVHIGMDVKDDNDSFTNQKYCVTWIVVLLVQPINICTALKEFEQ